MKVFWSLASFAFVCLSAAAVWMGGLNQDEGWYLYAANLVSEGMRPYADFAFTQGPVFPYVYAPFAFIWKSFGLLGGRVFTLLLGSLGVVLAALLAFRLSDGDRNRRIGAALVTTLLLGCNLYHLYYLTMPKTYALASLLVMAGFCILSFATDESFRLRHARAAAFAAALCGALLAFACGVRISLGAMLPVVGLCLLFRKSSYGLCFLWFGIGGVLALCLSYGAVLADITMREGFLSSLSYHASRKGFDPMWIIGSLSRLVRWYLPIFIVLGLGGFRKAWLLLLAFLAVFAVQISAPFPYEDYQVPVMSLLAVYAAVNFDFTEHRKGLLLVLGIAFACAFGSPLLEKWTTNGQDRFWTLKKAKSELAQLRDAARMVNQYDPNGGELFTQDLYLAVEANRKVPRGLEMGPFSELDDDGWRKLISSVECPVAAVSGYTFAIEPPGCSERPVERQLEYLKLLKSRYDAVARIADFGQNSTTLLILKRREK